MIRQPGSSFSPTKLLVPIDFSTSSQASLDAAGDLARMFQAQIELLHVIPMLPSPHDEAAIGVNFYPEDAALGKAQAHAEEQLKAFTDVLLRQGLRAHSQVQTGNDVVGNIVLALSQSGADMLVLSTHGASGWHQMVFGSIAGELLKQIQCPILLLHTPKPVSGTGYDHGESEASLALQPA